METGVNRLFDMLLKRERYKVSRLTTLCHFCCKEKHVASNAFGLMMVNRLLREKCVEHIMS